jgi:CheY-like chemotaxis protein
VTEHRGGVLRILLVEDEPEMAAALGAALKNYDMVVDHFSTLADAEEAVSVNTYGAILLDRQLPDGDGLTLIPKLRAKGLGVPVIVLTARGDLVDRVAGLNGGADDYLGKPFAVEELLARLRAVLRRPADMASETLTLGRLCFDFGQRQACVGDARRSIFRVESFSCWRRCCGAWGGRWRAPRSRRRSTVSTTKSSRMRWTLMSPGFAVSCPNPRRGLRSMPSAGSAIC